MDSDNEGESSDSLDLEMNQSIRRSSRLSLHLHEDSGDERVWRQSTHSSRRGRGRGRGGVSSSDEFDEPGGQKRPLRRDTSRSEEKRRRQTVSDRKEESVSDEEKGVGHTLVEMEHGCEKEVEEVEEAESALASTVVAKNGSVLTLPELNPPPEAVSRSMHVDVGCGLCSRRDTSDMVWCNRCGSEFHARCLYGEELDYNSWLCSECVSVLSELSPSFAYLQAGSEYVPANGFAPMGCPVRVCVSVEKKEEKCEEVKGEVKGEEKKGEEKCEENGEMMEVKKEEMEIEPTNHTQKEEVKSKEVKKEDKKEEDKEVKKEETKQKEAPFTKEKKRLKWLLSFGDKLVGSRVWLKERNLLGFVLYRMTDLLLFYVVFEGVAEGESGWYALEQGEVSVLRELVWVRGSGGLGCGVKEEVETGASGRVLDLKRGELEAVGEAKVEPVRDWREHRLELAFSPLLDTVRWEFRLGEEVRRCVSRPFKVPVQRVEMSGKEWMYKWVYVWKREVEFPLGGWSRGVVLQYRAMTGKHFVLFENEAVHSGWMYLNTQYVLVDGVSNEELMGLQPVSEEHCWCCLRGASEQPLYRCVKCGLFCHLACSDPARGGELSGEEASEFVCFKCAKCRGCETEVSFYGRWEHASVCGERVLCCEECKERYGEGLFCDVCLKTMSVSETRGCMKCGACGKWVHRECDGTKKEGRRREDSTFEEGVESEEEKEEDHSYRCPSCRREDMRRMVSALKAWDPAGIFVHPISEEFAPNYYDLIPREQSMCFEVMEARIRRKAYDRVQQVREDFELMCANAFVYNAVGDEVWKCTETLFEKGEAYLESEWRDTHASEYVEKVGVVRATKTKQSTRPAASSNAKQANLEASKMVRRIENYRVNGGKLEPCTPLAGPYSVVEVPMVAERVLARYSSTISYDVCLSCGSSGDRDRMLFCADCGECYHVYCVNLSGTVTREMREGWRCSNCKICEVCGAALTSQLGNGEVCSCNRCDRSFHKACLQYRDDENLNLFVCGHCFVCKKCGKRGSATTWSYHKDYCRECYAKEERFRECAVCGKPWSSSDVDMAFCESCEQWIHRRCIASDMVEWQKCDLTRTPYHCKRCRQQEVLTAGAAMASLASLASLTSLSGQRSEEGASVQRGLVGEIQEQRQELRVKELLQQETSSRTVRLAQLESRWRELVRTIIRVGLLKRGEG